MKFAMFATALVVGVFFSVQAPACSKGNSDDGDSIVNGVQFTVEEVGSCGKPDDGDGESEPFCGGNKKGDDGEGE